MRMTNSPTLDGKFVLQVVENGLKNHNAKPKLVNLFPAIAQLAIS